MDDDGLRNPRSLGGCMNWQNSSYTADNHCHTLLTCALREPLIPHGEHLTKKCRHWMHCREGDLGGAQRWRDERWEG